MRKVLLIANMYPSEKFKSYGTFISNIYSQLSEESTLKVSKIVMTKETNKVLKYLKYFWFNIRIVFQLLFFKYDVIYAHYVSHVAFPILIASKFKKLRIVSNIHGTDITGTSGIEAKFSDKTKKLLEISTKIVVPSEYFKQKVASQFELNGEKIVVSPSGGVNTDIFSPNVRKGLSSTKPVFAYISRIDKGKGWDVFLKALSHLNKEQINQGHFILVGSGSQDNDLHSLITDLGIGSIETRPAMSQKEMAHFIKEIDWLIYPSVLEESLGLIGLEAMTCGVPVIGTDYAGIGTYLVDGYNGYAFERGNDMDLSNRIAKALSISDDEYCRLSQGSFETSKNYTNAVAKKIIKDLMR